MDSPGLWTKSQRRFPTGFQPAVSPISNRQAVRLFLRARRFGRLAGWKPALRRTGGTFSGSVGAPPNNPQNDFDNFLHGLRFSLTPVVVVAQLVERLNGIQEG